MSNAAGIAPIKRLLGLSFEGKPIHAPKPSHSLLLAAAGSRKTTCGAVPWLLSLVADQSRALIVNDGKDGEIAAQCAGLCQAYGPRSMRPSASAARWARPALSRKA